MEQYKLVALSTGHIAVEERERMAVRKDWPFTVAPFEFGWFVSCLRPEADPELQAEFPGLSACRKYAAANGFGYILLDADAEEIEMEDLPYYPD